MTPEAKKLKDEYNKKINECDDPIEQIRLMTEQEREMAKIGYLLNLDTARWNKKRPKNTQFNKEVKQVYNRLKEAFAEVCNDDK